MTCSTFRTETSTFTSNLSTIDVEDSTFSQPLPTKKHRQICLCFTTISKYFPARWISIEICRSYYVTNLFIKYWYCQSYYCKRLMKAVKCFNITLSFVPNVPSPLPTVIPFDARIEMSLCAQ